MDPPATLMELLEQSEAVPRQPNSITPIPKLGPTIPGFGTKWLDPTILQKPAATSTAVGRRNYPAPSFQSLDEHMEVQHELSEQLFEAMIDDQDNLEPERLTRLLSSHLDYPDTRQVNPNIRAIFTAYTAVPYAPPNTPLCAQHDSFRANTIRNPIPSGPQTAHQVLQGGSPRVDPSASTQPRACVQTAMTVPGPGTPQFNRSRLDWAPRPCMNGYGKSGFGLQRPKPLRSYTSVSTTSSRGPSCASSRGSSPGSPRWKWYFA
jgi:hypothetical protein